MKLIKYQWPLIILLLTACSQDDTHTSEMVKKVRQMRKKVYLLSRLTK